MQTLTNRLNKGYANPALAKSSVGIDLSKLKGDTSTPSLFAYFFCVSNPFARLCSRASMVGCTGEPKGSPFPLSGKVNPVQPATHNLTFMSGRKNHLSKETVMSNTTQVASATIQTVTFNNQTIPAVLVDGVPYVCVKPIAENIGLDWAAQAQRLKRDDVLNSVMVMITTTGSDNKKYKMLCLPIQYLNGWLFGVDVNRVKPAIKDTLIQYQKECFQTLYEHFHNIPKQYAEPQHNEQSFFLSTTQAREFDAMMRGLNDLARLVSRNNTDAAKIFMNRARDMNKYLVKHDRNNN